MAVLGFQLFFLLLIVVSSLFGRSTRNWVVFGSVVFTIIAVFTSGLMILQFLTIFIGYLISENLYSKYNKDKMDSCLGKGCIWAFALILFLIVYNIITYYYFEDKSIKPKKKIYNKNYKNDSIKNRDFNSHDSVNGNSY